MNYSREVLYNRHRLSHHQINSLLNEEQNQLVFEEKVNSLRLLSEFLSITDFLQKHSIWFLPLKGPLLSYRIYGDATCRRYRDFDLMVKPDVAPDVIQILCEQGYVFEGYRWPDSAIGRAKVIEKINQFTLYHPEKYLTIEIHWRVFIDPIVEYDLIEKIVNKNIQKIDFAGRLINQFKLEFELLYLIIHGGLHTWRRLKWLLDVHEIVTRFEIDESKFDELVSLYKAQRMVGLCNAMLNHFFPNSTLLPVVYPVPEWFFTYCLRQINNNNKEYNPPFSLKHRMFYLNAFPDWKYKQKRILLLVASIKKLSHVFHHRHKLYN